MSALATRRRPVAYDPSKLKKNHSPIAGIRAASWDLESIRVARSQHFIGDFSSSASMALYCKSDGAIGGAIRARVSPHKTLSRTFDATNKKWIAPMRKIAPPIGQVSTDVERLAMLGMSISTIEWKTTARAWTPVVVPWPMSSVFIDGGRIMTYDADGRLIEIVHGDGKWIVAMARNFAPWCDGAVLGLATPWGHKAYAERDRTRTGATRGAAKLIGIEAEEIESDTPEGMSFTDTMLNLQNGANGATLAHGNSVKYAESMSSLYQIFPSTIADCRRDICIALLGNDRGTSSAGGNYVADAKLFEVRTELYQGDLTCVADAYETGLFLPWSIMNAGSDIGAVMGWDYPDPDIDQRQGESAKQTAAAVQTVAAMRDAGLRVTQPDVDAITSAFGAVRLFVTVDQRTDAAPADSQLDE